jgi:hypothetical protein
MTSQDYSGSVIRESKLLSVMLTYTCPAECDNCGTLSSPKNKENIPLEAALSYIDQAPELGFKLVVFTGGEATLRWKDLLSAIKHARSLGLATRLVTNAHWATHDDVASEKVAALIAAGLNEINFSTGDEHVRFIPLGRVTRAIVISIKAGLNTCVMIETRIGRTITRDSVLADPAIKQLSESELKQLALNESPWMPLNPDDTYAYPEGYTINKSNLYAERPCDGVLSTYTIQGDGKIGACCGLGMRMIPELNVGKVGDSLRDVMHRAEIDVVKMAIRYLGTVNIIAWAAEKDPTIQWENMYAHHCQACARIYTDERIRNIITEHWQELVPKIRDAAILDEVVIPMSMEIDDVAAIGTS